MARHIADVIAALDVVVGPEPTDLRSLPRPEAAWPAVLDRPQVPSRVAWCPTLGYAEVDAETLAVCERAVSVLESLGAEVVELPSVFSTDPVSQWLTLVSACTLRTIGDLGDDRGWDDVDPVLKALVDQARSTSARELIEILDECHRMNVRLVELFHDVRLLVTPTTAAAAPPLELEGAGMINGRADPNWVQLTYPFNMTRSPAATVCAGLTGDGIPVGLQLVGPQHGDLVVLRSAAALEDALGFDEVAPLTGGPR
jgi:aspartyl-tRNA(Asn)/glutamyl-tRNA(Gln) amidotransferase subunit A